MQREELEDLWLKASDFTEQGTELTMTQVENKLIAPSVEKQVLFFEETTKGLVLNEVNTKTIEKNTGETEKENWSGYKITLYPTAIIVKGELTPCIRVKFLVNQFAKKSTT